MTTVPRYIWQWADRYRVLSSMSSAEPGKYRTSRTPYLREIMEMLSPSSDVERVVVMKSAQMGFSEVVHNWLGYTVDGGGGPFMHLFPTAEVAARNVMQKIQPMLDGTPQLKAKMGSSRGSKATDSKLFKVFPGGLFISSGANSPAPLRNVSIKNLALDEVDGYPADTGEGPPERLAITRTDAFNDKKIYIVSTPTFDATSRIKRFYENSDQRQYHVPCPLCKDMITLKWEQLRWKEGLPEEGVKYQCQSCEGVFSEEEKYKILPLGKWVPKKPGHRGGRIVGYHINSLYSPYGMFSWINVASYYEEAKENPLLMISFYNLVLGLPYSDASYRLDWQLLFDRREKYAINSIPHDDIAFLTAGVDVQGDRLEVGIWGWRAYTREPFAIDHRFIFGNTSDESVFRGLDEILEETWQTPSGEKLFLSMMLVDSGFNTQRVYQFCRKYPISRVRPIKGDPNQRSVISHPKKIDQNKYGKKIRKGTRAFKVGVNIIKEEVAGWINLKKRDDGSFPDRYVHFPEFGEEWCKQMCSEQLTVKIAPSGERRYVWEKVNHSRNEVWDTFIYARAAAYAYGLDRYKTHHWDALLEARRRAHEEPEEGGPEVSQEKEAVPRSGMIARQGAEAYPEISEKPSDPKAKKKTRAELIREYEQKNRGN